MSSSRSNSIVESKDAFNYLESYLSEYKNQNDNDSKVTSSIIYENFSNELLNKFHNIIEQCKNENDLDIETLCYRYDTQKTGYINRDKFIEILKALEIQAEDFISVINHYIVNVNTDNIDTSNEINNDQLNYLELLDTKVKDISPDGNDITYSKKDIGSTSQKIVSNKHIENSDFNASSSSRKMISNKLLFNHNTDLNSCKVFSNKTQDSYDIGKNSSKTLSNQLHENADNNDIRYISDKFSDIFVSTKSNYQGYGATNSNRNNDHDHELKLDIISNINNNLNYDTFSPIPVTPTNTSMTSSSNATNIKRKLVILEDPTLHKIKSCIKSYCHKYSKDYNHISKYFEKGEKSRKGYVTQEYFLSSFKGKFSISLSPLQQEYVCLIFKKDDHVSEFSTSTPLNSINTIITSSSRSSSSSGHNKISSTTSQIDYIMFIQYCLFYDLQRIELLPNSVYTRLCKLYGRIYDIQATNGVREQFQSLFQTQNNNTNESSHNNTNNNNNNKTVIPTKTPQKLQKDHFSHRRPQTTSTTKPNKNTLFDRASTTPGPSQYRNTNNNNNNTSTTVNETYQTPPHNHYFPGYDDIITSNVTSSIDDDTVEAESADVRLSELFLISPDDIYHTSRNRNTSYIESSNLHHRHNYDDAMTGSSLNYALLKQTPTPMSMTMTTVDKLLATKYQQEIYNKPTAITPGIPMRGNHLTTYSTTSSTSNSSNNNSMLSSKSESKSYLRHQESEYKKRHVPSHDYKANPPTQIEILRTKKIMSEMLNDDIIDRLDRVMGYHKE